MPYLKCSPCKVRVVVAGREDRESSLSCPECCGSLETVDRLSELVGFRRWPVEAGAEVHTAPGALAPWHDAIAQSLPDPMGWSHDRPSHTGGTA